MMSKHLEKGLKSTLDSKFDFDLQTKVLLVNKKMPFFTQPNNCSYNTIFTNTSLHNLIIVKLVCVMKNVFWYLDNQINLKVLQTMTPAKTHPYSNRKKGKGNQLQSAFKQIYSMIL